MSSLTKQNDFAGWVWPAGRSLEDPVLGYWKNEHRFPYLKTAARELMGMTVLQSKMTATRIQTLQNCTVTMKLTLHCLIVTL